MSSNVKNITIGKVSIPLTQYASQGNAVLGIRDSGKSYSATYLAEQLYGGGIPFVAFDPSGVWKFLRVPGKGKGLPIVVAGGKAPDLPLTPQSAPEIVRAAMKSNVSLVLDLYDIHMSKADWSRIVESCVRVLLYENGEHGLRHIFIEEAAEFAPQQISGDRAKVYAEVEKLARIGGNALLGYTLINQRAEQVNKAVLELCDCLFLHRQKGKNSLNSLAKWLEYSQGGETKEIIRGLPTLPSGECWVWPAGAERATHVQMPQKNTFHPDRRALTANPATANIKRVDATKFVTELRGNLEKYLQEAKANDPTELRKRVSELERELSLLERSAPSTKEVIEAEKRGYDRGFEEASKRAYKRGWEEHADAVSSAIASMVKPPVIAAARPEGPARSFAPANAPATSAQTTSTGARARQIDERSLSQSNSDGEKLPKAERTFLTVLAQRRDQGKRTTRNQVALFAGYSVTSRHIDNTLAALRSAQFVAGGGGDIQITAAGLSALGNYEHMPSGSDLRAYWLREAGGKAEREMLQVVLDTYPRSLTRDEVAERSGYSVSSRHVDNTLARLRSLDLIHGPGTAIRASEDLFT